MGRRRIKPTPGALASAWLGFVYNVRKELSLRAQQLAFAQLLCVRRHPRSHSIAGDAVRLGAGSHLQVLLTGTKEPGGRSSASQSGQLAGPQINWALTALAGALRILGFLHICRRVCYHSSTGATNCVVGSCSQASPFLSSLRPIRGLSIIALSA